MGIGGCRRRPQAHLKTQGVGGESARTPYK